MPTIGFSESELSLLAIAAANVAGGRHEFRADSAIRQESSALVKELRRKSRNSARRETYRWRNVGERFAFDVGYTFDQNDAISEWQDALKSRPHSDAYMRNIARALFNPRAFARMNSDAADVDAYREYVLTDWRQTVREYVEWRDSVAAIGGRIPVSLADMRADRGSRFYNYATRKWNVAGYAEFLFGADVSDAFQNGMVSAIASGDWINPRGDGRVTGCKVPTYGALWRHIALAVRRAVWQNTRFTYDAPEREFDWAEWERTANDSVPSVALRADSANRQTIAEWAEYQEWRAVRDAVSATVARIAEERAERIRMLESGRQAIAQLLIGGMSIGRIARALGRTVEGLERDLSAPDAFPLAMRFLPTRPETLSETADRLEAIARMNGHAANLRTKYADAVADNYANGRVFRRADIPAPTSSGMAEGARTVSRSAMTYDASAERKRLAFRRIASAGMALRADCITAAS